MNVTTTPIQPGVFTGKVIQPESQPISQVVTAKPQPQLSVTQAKPVSVRVVEPTAPPPIQVKSMIPVEVNFINSARRRYLDNVGSIDDDHILNEMVQRETDPGRLSFYKAALQRGADSTQILDEILTRRGYDPESTKVTQPTELTNEIEDTGSFAGNVLESSKNFVKGLGNIVAHPIKTASSLLQVGKGIVETPLVLTHNLVTGKDADEEGGWKLDNPTYEAFVDAMGKRYGSWEAVKTTAYRDPIGFLADASILLDAGGTIATKLGNMSKLSSVAKTGQAISKVGETLNPIYIAAKPLGKIVDWTKAGLSEIAPKLETINLRLTPAQKLQYSAKLNKVADYIAKDIPIGSPESRFAASTADVAKMESKVENLLANEAKEVTVTRNSLLDQIENLKNEFAGERDALEIDRQIDGFKKLLETKYPEEIPVLALNKLKRSTMQSAFNQAGTKISDVAEYRLGDILYDNLKAATEGVGSESLANINERYATVITAHKLLKIASTRPQTGFIERLIGASAGAAIGSQFGGFGTAAGVYAGKAVTDMTPATAIRSAVGKATRGASKLPNISPNTKVLNTMSRVNTHADDKNK